MADNEFEIYLLISEKVHPVSWFLFDKRLTLEGL